MINHIHVKISMVGLPYKLNTHIPQRHALLAPSIFATSLALHSVRLVHHISSLRLDGARVSELGYDI